jgi:CheY-like chemotaxis protein
LRRLGAKLSVSSLEDLGCSVRLELPLQAVMVREYPMYQTAIFVDADPQRGALLKQSIYALAEQVIYIQQPQQLQAELQNRLVDLVLIQLPEQQDSFTAEDELLAVASRGHLVGFCAAEQLSYWTDRLTFPVLSNPMLSATVRATLSALPQQNRSRLLVVDDNTTNLAFVKAMLSHQELEVDSAASGEEAIRLAKSNRYQLILMDIQLPDMSGVLATHLIRQLPQHQHTQIMAFTAHALPAEIEQFRQAGMNDVVIKPLDAAKVATLIRHCLSPDLQSQSPVPAQTVV